MSEDPRERSGNWQLPNTQPPVAPASIPIDARTIGMAVLFLFGGGLTGAGTSMLGGSGIAEKIEKLVTDVQALQRSVDNFSAESRSIERAHDGYQLMLADHEKRLRDIESKRNR